MFPGPVLPWVLCLAIWGTAAFNISEIQAQQTTNNPAAESVQQLEAKIKAWITQLGDSQYANREKAQEELRRVGTAAFDLLISAQDHPDVEIAQRARYLVRSIPVEWAGESDSHHVKSLLTNFGELGKAERRTRAQHLAKLENGAGTEALCRLVRFESDKVLSKQAALLIMSRDISALDASQRKQLAETIRKGTQLSKRPAVEWLQIYANELENPGSSLADWERITQSELETLAKAPKQSDGEVARDLLRWQTKLLLNRNRPQEALANFRRTYDLINDVTAEIYESLDWAIEHQLFLATDEIAARFAARVNNEPQLLYRLAESQLKRGDQTTADKTALAASQLNWGPGKHDEHMVTAKLLYERGLPDWSANEYRRVIADTKIETLENAEARGSLSENLYDLGREMEAADVLKPSVEHVDKENKETEISQMVKSVFRGNMHYRYAMHYAKVGDREKQIEHLNQAIKAYPDNIDILIAMYRLPNPEEKWKQDVQKRIDAHLGQCRTLISRFEEVLRMQPNREGLAGSGLATAYNELAWLISNTSGDYQEAIRASQRSLELDNDSPAYLDTLGRCYFAAGDLENAVKFQRRAVKAMPFMQIMQRQLKVFEAALEKSKAAKN